MNPVRLLVTRPDAEAARTAATLRSLGHHVTALPLLRIEAVPDAALGTGPWAAVLFTSANAVRAMAQHCRFRELVELPVYAVGARTRAAAAAAGFGSVRSADGGLGDLVNLLASELPGCDLPMLYPAGRDRSGDLGAALAQHGKIVETVVVYRSVAAVDAKDRLGAALKAAQIDAVLHYSARTAAAFLTLATAAGARESAIAVKHFCLSAQVAAPLIAAGAADVEIAACPNEEALLRRIGAGS